MFFFNYNLTPLDIYNGLSQVYCIKPEGNNPLVYKGLKTLLYYYVLVLNFYISMDFPYLCFPSHSTRAGSLLNAVQFSNFLSHIWFNLFNISYSILYFLPFFKKENFSLLLGPHYSLIIIIFCSFYSLIIKPNLDPNLMTVVMQNIEMTNSVTHALH